MKSCLVYRIYTVHHDIIPVRYKSLKMDYARTNWQACRFDLSKSALAVKITFMMEIKVSVNYYPIYKETMITVRCRPGLVLL